MVTILQDFHMKHIRDQRPSMVALLPEQVHHVPVNRSLNANKCK